MHARHTIKMGFCLAVDVVRSKLIQIPANESEQKKSAKDVRWQNTFKLQTIPATKKMEIKSLNWISEGFLSFILNLQQHCDFLKLIKNTGFANEHSALS